MSVEGNIQFKSNFNISHLKNIMLQFFKTLGFMFFLPLYLQANQTTGVVQG